MRPTISDYFALARTGREAWWQWIIGFVFVIGFYLLATLLIYTLAYTIAPHIFYEGIGDYALLLISFLPLFFSLFLVTRFWHRRSSLSLLTSSPRFRWRHVFSGCVAVIFVYAAFIGIEALFFPEDLKELTLNSDMSVFIPCLILTLLFVPFQAASEEIFLRGYLNQALIKYLRSPWLVFFVTSGLFAWLHTANPEAEGQMWPYMAVIFLFGVAACVLLYFEGGIESAIGIHIMNNLFAFGIIGYSDPELPDTALFMTPEPVITWTDVGWETLSLALVVGLTLWLNRRSERSTNPDSRTATV